MQSLVTPYLFFSGRCEEAIQYYCEALGAELQMKVHYHESPVQCPEGMLQAGFEKKVMHATLRIGTALLYCSDGVDDKPVFDGFRLALSVNSHADANRLFHALAEQGTVEMPLTETFWSPLYGMVMDRFRVGWMVMVSDEVGS